MADAAQSSSYEIDLSKGFLFDIPGQHVYDGAIYLDFQPVEILEGLAGLNLTPEDILVATYPKSGTTWMCEIADVVHHEGDTKHAKAAYVYDRWQFVEAFYDDCNRIDLVNSSPSPRFVKTHMTAKYFERQVRTQGVKTFAVLRNPKDTLVSFYHFYRMNMVYSFPGTWDDFFELVRHNQLNYGSWFDHVLSWWQLRDLPNVEVFKYEDMLADKAGTVRRVAKFLGKTLSEETVQSIVEHTSFKNMKDNPTTNYVNNDVMDVKISPFMRKGEVGDWKNYFSKEQSSFIDDLVEKKFKNSGLQFTYE